MPVHLRDLDDLARRGDGAVVVGVDGSEQSRVAVRHAATRAARSGRRLVVAMACDWPGDTGRPPVAAAVATAASEVAHRSHPGLRVDTVVEDGDARTLLLALAERAELLVVGSRGRGPLRSLLVGSVGATLAQLAPCPVHVCRPRPPTPRDGVLVAADGTPDSAPVLAHAFAQAELTGAALHVVHYAFDAAVAADLLRGAPPSPASRTEGEELRVLLAESVAGLREQHPDVPVTLGVDHGLVDAALAVTADRWELVVVGRHPVDSARRLLTGSVATAVLERAHTTVAVVPVRPGAP